MSGCIIVRAARADDKSFLAACNAAMAWETERKSLDRAVLAAGVAGVLDEPRRGFYLVAELAGELTGCLMITTEWSDWRNGNWWWIQSVYVMPAARRHGVFRALHAETERRAQAAPEVIGLRLYVERDNQSAQATYAGLGMQQTHYLLFERAF
ncbi:MAG: GNAT family N-acetyltransferase [Rhodanobacteraceae bacterium]